MVIFHSYVKLPEGTLLEDVGHRVFNKPKKWNWGKPKKRFLGELVATE